MNKSSVLGLLTLVMNATAMAGAINMGTPLTAGAVLGIHGPRVELSSEQLQALSHWLEQHKSGWQGMITEATSEPTQLQVDLKHSDGTITSLCIVARAGGGQYLRLTGPDEWAYRSFGGIFKSWAATRSLTDQELSVLREIANASP